jgi:hypothetical protein
VAYFVDFIIFYYSAWVPHIWSWDIVTGVVMLTGWNVVHLGFDCRQRQAYYSYQICPNPRLEPIQHRIRFGLSIICTWVKRMGLIWYSERIWHLEDRASWCILIIKPNRCTISQLYFGKQLYMFRTDLLSIIKILNTVFKAIGICRTSCCEYSIKTPDGGQ